MARNVKEAILVFLALTLIAITQLCAEREYVQQYNHGEGYSQKIVEGSDRIEPVPATEAR